MCQRNNRNFLKHSHRRATSGINIHIDRARGFTETIAPPSVKFLPMVKDSGYQCSERSRVPHRRRDAYHGHEASDNARTTSQGAFPRIYMQKYSRPVRRIERSNKTDSIICPSTSHWSRRMLYKGKTLRGEAAGSCMYTRAHLVP